MNAALAIYLLVQMAIYGTILYFAVRAALLRRKQNGLLHRVEAALLNVEGRLTPVAPPVGSLTGQDLIEVQAERSDRERIEDGALRQMSADELFGIGSYDSRAQDFDRVFGGAS